MSFQAYLDTIERKTGKTPAELLAEAGARGYDATTKAGVVLQWLKDDYDLGRGHGMALFHVLNHSLFKSLLFFGSGAVLNATGVLVPEPATPPTGPTTWPRSSGPRWSVARWCSPTATSTPPSPTRVRPASSVTTRCAACRCGPSRTSCPT